MIDSSKKLNSQLAFELQNSHVCEKRSKKPLFNQEITFHVKDPAHGLHCISQSPEY